MPIKGFQKNSSEKVIFTFNVSRNTQFHDNVNSFKLIGYHLFSLYLFLKIFFDFKITQFSNTIIKMNLSNMSVGNIVDKVTWPTSIFSNTPHNKGQMKIHLYWKIIWCCITYSRTVSLCSSELSPSTITSSMYVNIWIRNSYKENMLVVIMVMHFLGGKKGYLLL